jgi:hypothetical protein
MAASSTSLRRRLALTGALTLGLVALGTAPASAHVEASADGAQAGAGPVVVTFSAEAESTTAGIVSARAQLPEGIPPASVSLAGAPAGWAFAPTADGYEVSGPDLGVGVDLEFGISVERLPADATELPFKTIVRYADGDEDAWIELSSDGAPEPDFPAPTITVAAAAPSAAPTPTPTTAGAPSASAGPGSASPEAASSSDDDGGSATPWIVAGVVVVLAALGAGIVLTRRRASGTH